MSHISEGVMLNKENTSELVDDTSKEIELQKDHKIKIERVNSHDLYLITSDGTRVKIIDQLDAHNGNIYLIDHVLHTPSKNENLHQLHGYGRNSISGGDSSSSSYFSKAYENKGLKQTCSYILNIFYLLAIIIKNIYEF